MRRVELAVFAALLAAATLLQGAAGSTALLGRALGSPTGAELRGTGASAALSTGGLRTRLTDRVGAGVRGSRHAGGQVAPAAAAHADHAAASGIGAAASRIGAGAAASGAAAASRIGAGAAASGIGAAASGASGTGIVGGPAAVLTRQPVPVAVAALALAVVALLLAAPTAGRGRPAGRAPPLSSGV